MKLNRWQDWTNGILGLWAFLSPWILGFAAGPGVPAFTAWILGIAIIVFAGVAVYMPKAWEEGLNILLGLCLVGSPWALRFTHAARPTANAVIVGLLVITFGVWAMVRDAAVQKWWHDRHLLH